MNKELNACTEWPVGELNPATATQEEMEYMINYNGLLTAEEFLVNEILNGEGDAWNEHKARIEAMLQGQTLTKGEY